MMDSYSLLESTAYSTSYSTSWAPYIRITAHRPCPVTTVGAVP